jgi:hypothetical protein
MAFKLFDHQAEAVDQLSSGSILCGGVGTGKSLTSLGFYMKKYIKRDLYIITTAKKRDSLEWEAECAKFALSKHRTSLDDTEITIDSWNNIKKYIKVTSAFFIFDEQRIVGAGAWVKSFLKIAKKNKWILLTATPGDTWTDYIPVFVANGFYKNRTEFLQEHAVYSRYTKYPKIDRFLGVGTLLKFKEQVVVDMYYKKSTIPNKVTIVAEYDKPLFDKALVQRWNPYKNAPIKNISELCYTLRKIVNSDKSRAAIVKKVLRDHKRVIIFYNFDYELDALLKLSKKLKIQTNQWNGHAHEEVPTNEEWIYLVQYTAGAEGWNCVETNVILFYSLNYSYRMMTQAAGRIDRLNTSYRDLHYYHITSESKIDKAIEKALVQKKNFNINKFVKD